MSLTVNAEVLRLARVSIEDMRTWQPPWSESDIFHAACGAVLKYAYAQGQEDGPELLAVIETVVKQEMMNMNMNTMRTRYEALHAALEAFLTSPAFEQGVIASTRASWSGSGFSVELFPDGSFSTLWDAQIGNLYESPGTILALPALDDDDLQECLDGGMSEEEFFSLGFANEQDEMAASLRASLEDSRPDQDGK